MSDFPEVKDHLVANPDKYDVTQNADGTWTIRPTWVDNPSEVLQEGTPVDAAFLSKIPEAIDAIDTKVTSQLADKASQADADSAHLRIDGLLIESGDANAEVVDAHVSTVKNKTFTTVRNRFEDIEKGSYLPLENLAMNGDLSGGTSGWIGIGSTVSAVDKKLTVAGTGTNVQVQAENTLKKNKSVGNKYFVKLGIKLVQGSSTRFGVFSGSTVVTNWVTNPTVGNTHEIKAIVSASDTLNKLKVIVQYATTADAAIGVFEITYVTVIDLTTTFGGGQEPSIEMVEDLLKFHQNSWFDGIDNLLSPSRIAYEMDNKKLLESSIKNTTQKLFFNLSGDVERVEHQDSSSIVIREDSFTYATNLITEVRTLRDGQTLTFKYHLDTLETEVI